MWGLPAPVIASFIGLVGGQLVALSLLPRTLGFTRVAATLLCCAAYLFSVWMIARIIHSGVNLGILIPLIAAVIPLGSVVIGVALYGESASVLKIALLIGACVLVGVASRVA